VVFGLLSITEEDVRADAGVDVEVLLPPEQGSEWFTTASK
jgi:hypothetical protein